MESSNYLDVFIEESKDNLQTLNGTLLELEQDGFDEEGMNAAFRAMHTIKGTAGVIGIAPIQQLAHVMEDLFDDLRKKKETPPRHILELLFAGVDRIEDMLAELEVSGETHLSVVELVEGMRSAMEDPPAADTPLADAPEPAPEGFVLEPGQLEQVRELLQEQVRERPRARSRRRSLVRRSQASSWHRASRVRWCRFSRPVRWCHCASCRWFGRRRQLPWRRLPTALPLC